MERSEALNRYLQMAWNKSTSNMVKYHATVSKPRLIKRRQNRKKKRSQHNDRKTHQI